MQCLAPDGRHIDREGLKCFECRWACETGIEKLLAPGNQVSSWALHLRLFSYSPNTAVAMSVPLDDTIPEALQDTLQQERRRTRR
jgi:hypothetical protein